MNSATQSVAIPGPAGRISVACDAPTGPVRGVAVIAHPHPLYGGTRDNKVVQTLARALVAEGYQCWRPDFRGVGETEGVHDEGRGETEDLLAVVAHARTQASAGLPLVLGGFSFGSFVQARVAQRLAHDGHPAARLVLVGVAASRFTVEAVPEDTLVIHGEIDDVVPLTAVFDWARPLGVPVVVLPGTGHFFHGRLGVLRRLVQETIAGAPPRAADAAGRPPAVAGD